ncbi:MAG: demethylase [Muribaculaceae bacterium]|nr:demethylase [Muribaculaceae bacterium]
MAKILNTDKPFLLIECSAVELMNAVGSDHCVCDWCDKSCLPSEKGCYIAVLNHWYCKECFEKWIGQAEYYPEDVDVERKNFDFYTPRFGLKCQ